MNQYYVAYTAELTGGFIVEADSKDEAEQVGEEQLSDIIYTV